jgi:ADP-glucose pyrophosphorylase
VVDEGCVIPDGTVIGEDPELDAARFHVTPAGVVLVTPDMLVPGPPVVPVRPVASGQTA